MPILSLSLSPIPLLFISFRLIEASADGGYGTGKKKKRASVINKQRAARLHFRSNAVAQSQKMLLGGKGFAAAASLSIPFS